MSTTSKLDPAPGERWGRYRIERRLGAGGMGAVFAAWDELLDRPVALKQVHSGGDDALVQEARALAACNHSNIVRIYGIERAAGRFLAVMERIEGRSLDDELRESCLAPAAVAEVVRSIAAALTAIHAVGSIHGDVKPSNILRESGTGRILLTDFGLAQSIDATESHRLLRGTPDYIAPERARGLPTTRELRARQDVYSLAATAFDLLTGRPPFEHPELRELLRKQAYEEPPRPSLLRPGLSWRIDRALLAALRKRPEERTATPALLASDLADAVARASAPPRILLVDDDEDHRQVVALGLAKRLGRIVIESVADGQRAYHAAAERAPDLAIIDLEMPHMNGLELVIALRSLPALARLPILIVSGHLGSVERDLLGRLGVERCFDKPVLLWQVASAIRDLIGIGVERASGRFARRHPEPPRRETPPLENAG